MGDYKLERWCQMVADAAWNLAGDCPMQDDEVILWAHHEMANLENALRDCVRHMKTAGSPEAVRACEAAERLLGVER